MDLADGSGRYGLGHFDIGTRIHFLAGPHRVVPFVQFGLSARAVGADFTRRFRPDPVTAVGAGAGFGGGINAHFTPRFAFSAAVVSTVGNFSEYESNQVAVTGSSFSVASARVHIGVIWFSGK